MFPQVGRRAIGWILPLALLHGLIYLLLLPPWQHYDEPTHFLYAATLAGLDEARLSREIADSMYRHSFWEPGYRPNLLGPSTPQIGVDQRVHPPLYYTLIAAVITPIRYLSIETQLYAARLVSLLLYGLTLLAGWRIAMAILPDEPLAVETLTLLLLLTPAFADLMTAVNSDALVNFGLAAAMLGCALLLRDGPRAPGVALAILGLAAALLAKRTAFVAVVPVALALFWSLRRRPLPWWAYAGGAAALALALGIAGLEPQLVPGAAGEHLALMPRPWLALLDETYLRLQIGEWLQSVSDWPATSSLYLPVVDTIFTSFWARLAWGHIGLGPAVDWLLRALAALAALGLLAGALRRRDELDLAQRRWIWLCLVAVCCAWLATIGRLHPLGPSGQPLYLPRGRYMFWALIPTLWLLALGWQSIIPARWRPYGLYALVAALALLDLAAIASIAWYYYA